MGFTLIVVLVVGYVATHNHRYADCPVMPGILDWPTDCSPTAVVSPSNALPSRSSCGRFTVRGKRRSAHRVSRPRRMQHNLCVHGFWFAPPAGGLFSTDSSERRSPDTRHSGDHLAQRGTVHIHAAVDDRGEGPIEALAHLSRPTTYRPERVAAGDLRLPWLSRPCAAAARTRAWSPDVSPLQASGAGLPRAAGISRHAARVPRWPSRFSVTAD